MWWKFFKIPWEGSHKYIHKSGNNGKYALLCQSIRPHLWLEQNTDPRLSLLWIRFVSEIIVEIGLLPIKTESFCRENLSYPCIPFYSNWDWTSKSLVKQRKMMGSLVFFFPKEGRKNWCLRRERRIKMGCQWWEGTCPSLGSLVNERVASLCWDLPWVQPVGRCPLRSEQALGCRPSRDEPMARATLGTAQLGDICLFLTQLTTGRCWSVWFSPPLSTLKIMKCSLSKGESITAVYILDISVGEAAKCDACLFKICFTGRASLNTCLFFL